jgi:Fe-S-cluster containining protein
MWKANNRNDILAWVSVIEAGGLVFAYDIWMHPETGEDVEVCPWLIHDEKRQRYACSIHDMKPEICRNYPHNAHHASETGCKGYK